MRTSPAACVAFWFAALVSNQAVAQPLTANERAEVDKQVRAALEASGAPGASIAIVRGGEIVYEQGYGEARIGTSTPVTPSMRFAIGSVSKQFTATAILLLEEEGKLSLDDKVAKWFPQLTRAKDISIRQLLSMTAGYQDFWPQDYVFPDMQQPVTAETIMQRWAGKPLDFEPGTRWQYSNTNYVIAGAIVERVSGTGLMEFLRSRIFTPLKMTSVTDFDRGPLSAADAAGYLRNAVGPLRPAPKEASGWLFGAGQLAMTAHDLALWDIAVMNRSVLRSASYKAQQTDMLLAAGHATGYGLGVNVTAPRGRRRISHGGAVSGYGTSNHVYPDDRAAIVAFTNIYPGAPGATERIAGRIAEVIVAATDAAADEAHKVVRAIYIELMKGTIDRTRLTPAANAYFSSEVLSDYAASLAPLGPPTEFARGGESQRGGMTVRSYRIRAGGATMDLTTLTLPDGRIEQYIISKVG